MLISLRTRVESMGKKYYPKSDGNLKNSASKKIPSLIINH